MCCDAVLFCCRRVHETVR